MLRHPQVLFAQVAQTAACKLQRLGVIEYHPRHITVLERAQLEALSCKCYAVVRNETERLLDRTSLR
ncbi:hypothetical protein D3C78_1272740 [compost metagenome]